jgi:glutathionyl-hydroquinone reductase
VSCIVSVVYSALNLNLAACADGVYKAGFAKTSEAYQVAVVKVFETLDRVEALLKDKTYLVGGRLTEADIRLFVTIVSSGSPCAFERVLSTNL